MSRNSPKILRIHSKVYMAPFNPIFSTKKEADLLAPDIDPQEDKLLKSEFFFETIP